ncbi:mannose-P-dolichol utilization defect 1 protein [Diaporthe sp. PMI_573]|nr:mannose-P-dolichol utilization defect 1 protein [Diaporthaceae sp. PMI_573]
MESLRDTLQPILQPITHNLPGPIRDLGVSLIGDKCYSSLVMDIDVADEACLKLAVSKALGVGIVAASSVVKVPQIINLARSRSASGVSFLSYLLETSSYLISLAYNVRNGFPFSTYGETALILGQNVVITVLVLNYSGRAGFAALFVAALAGALGALFTEGLLDAKTMGFLQAGAGTLGVVSKLPQIAAIWQEGGTGQLSAFTVFNYLLGSLARVFTTLQEVDDKLILYSFVAGFALNLVLALQMLYYWNQPSAKALGKRKEKALQPVAASSPANSATGSSTTTTTPKKAPTTRRRG